VCGIQAAVLLVDPLSAAAVFDSGGMLVDPADRDALYEAMEGR
jgi:hypothetical protein